MVVHSYRSCCPLLVHLQEAAGALGERGGGMAMGALKLDVDAAICGSNYSLLRLVVQLHDLHLRAVAGRLVDHRSAASHAGNSHL